MNLKHRFILYTIFQFISRCNMHITWRNFVLLIVSYKIVHSHRELTILFVGTWNLSTLCWQTLPPHRLQCTLLHYVIGGFLFLHQITVQYLVKTMMYRPWNSRNLNVCLFVNGLSLSYSSERGLQKSTGKNTFKCIEWLSVTTILPRVNRFNMCHISG